jgi:predicted dinucleotide-binding enzyme
MRISVIGTGKIGSTLGRALARAGHEVALGSRHPDGGQRRIAFRVLQDSQ